VKPILAALIIMVLGGVIYILTEKPKPMELARIMFWCGLLIALYVLGTAPPAFLR
jgi:hypothetical protein